MTETTDEARVIAVDGGSSKTELAVVTASGILLAAARGPGSNPHHIGVDGCVAVIDELHSRALQAAGDGPRPAHAVYVLAGADSPEEERALEEAIGARSWSGALRVRNDTYAVLRAGSNRGWGVAVVCGAGINAVGVGPDGQEVRFPALGPLSGDWGGGLELGLAAVGAANRAEDGRGPDTVLRDTVPAQFELATPSAVAIAFHRKHLDDARLAELAPLVLAASDAGDMVAQALVDRLAGEVSDLVTTTLRRLAVGDRDVDVVLGGGLMQAGNSRLDATIDRSIVAAAPRAHVVRPEASPIAGAALLALDMLDARADVDVDVDAVVRTQFATEGWRDVGRQPARQPIGASDG